MKHFLLLFLMLFPAISDCFAQTSADTTGLAGPHHLLWFKGYWKSSSTFIITNDNTLTGGNATTESSSNAGTNANNGSHSNSGSGVNTGSSTNSGSSAYTGNGSGEGSNYITVTPDHQLHLHSTGINAWNQKVDSALQQIDVWEQQLKADANNVDLPTHHLNETQLPDVEDMKAQWNSLKVDQQQDILSADVKQNSQMSELGDDCVKFKPWYDEIMAYYQAHRHDKDADLNNPWPPQLDYTCYACDSDSRRNNDTIVARYFREFVQPEANLVKKGLTILHTFALMGVQEGKLTPQQFVPLWDENKKDPSKSGPCAYVDESELSNAINEILNHEYRRAVKLLYDNRNNFKAVQAVIVTYLKSARAWVMVGGGRESNRNMEELVPIVRKLFDYYYQKLKQNDWTQIGNYPYLLSLIRDMELLGASGDTELEFLDKLRTIINHFQLTIEPDVKVGTDQGYDIGHLKGKCFIIPDFERDSDQCYKWVIADDNARNFLGFRKAKPIQRIDCDVITNEMVVPGPRPVYIGTKHYCTNLQELHMDFCNPGSDTLLLSAFYPNPRGDGIWLFPHDVKMDLEINHVDQFFKSISDMVRLARSGEAEKMANNIKAKAEQMEAEMKGIQQKMNSSSDKLSGYQQILEMAQKTQNLTSSIKVAPIIYLDFKLPVTNNSTVLVNKRYDARQINPQISEALIYGYFTVKIENTESSIKTVNLK